MNYISYAEGNCAKDCFDFLSKLMRLESMDFDMRVNNVFFSAKPGYFFEPAKVDTALSACNEYINLLLHERNLLATAEISLCYISGCCTRLACHIKVNDYSSVEAAFGYYKKRLEEKIKTTFDKYEIKTAGEWSTELVDVCHDKYYGTGVTMCISVPLCDERLDYGYVSNRAISVESEFRDELSRSVLTEIYNLAKKETIAIESRIAGIGYNYKKYFYAICFVVGV